MLDKGFSVVRLAAIVGAVVLVFLWRIFFSLVEAAGVEPASENVTGQENYMLSRVHAPGITLGRSRPALRTDKKRVPLACGLSLSSQT